MNTNLYERMIAKVETDGSWRRYCDYKDLHKEIEPFITNKSSIKLDDDVDQIPWNEVKYVKMAYDHISIIGPFVGARQVHWEFLLDWNWRLQQSIDWLNHVADELRKVHKIELADQITLFIEQNKDENHVPF